MGFKQGMDTSISLQEQVQFDLVGIYFRHLPFLDGSPSCCYVVLG